MSTKERLAQVLHAAALFDLEKRARNGEFDDFESESATPITDLIKELVSQGGRQGRELAKRAMAGEFDATKAEAEAWRKRNPMGV